MTGQPDRHTPAAEFRARLERDVLDTLRRESRVSPPSPGAPAAWRSPWRTALPLAAGLVLGVGVQFAAGQVQDARQRTAVVATLTQDRQLAAVKLEIARSAYDLARQRFDVGAGSRPALLAAEADLREREAAVKRVDLDIEEARRTATDPRNDLWAPKIGDRDFVKERLTLDAYTWQQRASSLSGAVAEVRRAVDAGASPHSALEEAEAALADAQAEFNLRAYKLTLRDQFLEQHLTPEELGRRLQRFQVTTDVRRMRGQLALAESRLKRVNEGAAVGVVGALETKQAELEVLQLRFELSKLATQLKALGAGRPE
jgi:hypothetical protein